jgi:hypothetical protein
MFSVKILASALASVGLVASLSACAPNGSEHLPDMQTACASVTSAYESWIITGGNSESATGSLGRQGTINALDSAMSMMAIFVSDAELEAGRESLGEKENGFTAAELAAGLSNFKNVITNWEALDARPWTAGEMATIDGIYENAVKKTCASLAGTDAAAQGLENQEAREVTEADAVSYSTIEEVIAAYEQAGGDCSNPTFQDANGENYQAFCESADGTATGSVWMWPSFEYSRPEKTYDTVNQIYGPTWSIDLPIDLDIDPASVADKMGGIFYQ